MELGKQLARIKDYGITTNKSGNNSAFIQFVLAGGEELGWYGTLKKNDGTVNEITLEQLFECGFSGDDVKVLAKGVDSNALIVDEDIDITIVKELGLNGQDFYKIKFIGEGKQIQRTNVEDIKLPDDMALKIRELRLRKKPRERKDQKVDIPF